MPEKLEIVTENLRELYGTNVYIRIAYSQISTTRPFTVRKKSWKVVVGEPFVLCLKKVVSVDTKMASHILKRLLVTSRSTPALSLINRNFSKSSSLLIPRVQHPAPTFKTQAVVNGAFKEISLEVTFISLFAVIKLLEWYYILVQRTVTKINQAWVNNSTTNQYST